MAIRDLVPVRHHKHNHLPQRHNEADPFVRFQYDMNRLFDDFLSVTGSPDALQEDLIRLSPRVDIAMDDHEITVSAELPGMEEKDIQIEMDDNTVTIRGEREDLSSSRKWRWSQREQVYGAFQRIITLPAAVDGAKTKARFKKGILTITAPKREQGENRHRITVASN